MNRYHCNPKFRERCCSANCVDLDQTAPKEQSDLGLHCLPSGQHFSHPFPRGENILFKILGKFR